MKESRMASIVCHARPYIPCRQVDSDRNHRNPGGGAATAVSCLFFFSLPALVAKAKQLGMNISLQEDTGFVGILVAFLDPFLGEVVSEDCFFFLFSFLTRARLNSSPKM